MNEQQNTTRMIFEPARWHSLRQQWNDACLSAGVPALTLPTCAKIMAILLHFGNNEAFVLSPHFRADCDYIQKRYHVCGGETPAAEFTEELRRYSEQVENLAEPPKWAKDLFKNMYNINI